MRHSQITLVVFAVCMVVPLSVEAQAFRALGFLDPNAPDRYSLARAVSGDGTTVVGESNGQAFRWTAATPNSLQPLGFLPGGVSSAANCVSANGAVVGGKSDSAEGPRAFRWTSPAGMVSLGTLQGTVGESSATGCSADGSVMVGYSPGAALVGRGFRWTEATGMVELGTLPFPGKDAYATAVSADGSVAVGRSGCCENTGAVMAVRWTQAGGTVAEGLGDLPGTAPESPWSAASGISANGQVIVGGGGGFYLAFRWSGGTMTELTPPLYPPPNNNSSAMDASADGSVIVGAAASGSGDPVSTPVGPIPGGRAFIWTASEGIRDIKAVLTNVGLGAVLQGWTLEIATAISDDGNIIAGYGTHNGVKEGWVAALSGTPFPSSEPDGPAPSLSRRWLTIQAGLRESHGFLWHPTKGPQPIKPDPPPFVTAELLAFELVPRGGSQRADAIAFSLENPVALPRNAWSDVALVVDENANGTVDATETTTVAGPGYADPMGRLVFFQPFKVEAPTRYILRARIAGLARNARVTVGLRETGVVAAYGAWFQGSTLRHLTVETATASRAVWPWVLITLAIMLVVIAAVVIARRGPTRA